MQAYSGFKEGAGFKHTKWLEKSCMSSERSLSLYRMIQLWIKNWGQNNKKDHMHEFFYNKINKIHLEKI